MPIPAQSAYSFWHVLLQQAIAPGCANANPWQSLLAEHAPPLGTLPSPVPCVTKYATTAATASTTTITANTIAYFDAVLSGRMVWQWGFNDVHIIVIIISIVRLCQCHERSVYNKKNLAKFRCFGMALSLPEAWGVCGSCPWGRAFSVMFFLGNG
jgi:hypothetical protein